MHNLARENRFGKIEPRSCDGEGSLGDQVKTRVDRQGRIMLPAEMRRRLGIEPGDTLVIDVGDDVVKLLTRRQALDRARRYLKRFVPDGVSLADELIADRRAEVEREEAS